MFELLSLFVFIWLLSKTIGLALKLTWGVAKIAWRPMPSSSSLCTSEASVYRAGCCVYRCCAATSCRSTSRDRTSVV